MFLFAAISARKKPIKQLPKAFSNNFYFRPEFFWQKYTVVKYFESEVIILRQLTVFQQLLFKVKNIYLYITANIYL